jgi:uncharacterized protein (DUF1810 family)
MRSAMAKKYAIDSLDEATAYLAHPLLGERLRHCTRLINAVTTSDIEDIFAYPDNLKFHSSTTLFSHASDDNAIFRAALKKFFQGRLDPETVRSLKMGDGMASSRNPSRR